MKANGKSGNGKPKNGKHPGRPRTIPSPEEFDARVDAYLDKCEQAKKPPTFTGMALYLGFASRWSFYDYGKLPEYSQSVKRATAAIEETYEEQLRSTACTGAIFALKNHGWSDRLDLAGKVEIETTEMPPKEVWAALERRQTREELGRLLRGNGNVR